MRVEIRHLSKTFDAYKALDEVSLDVREGEFCALLGPSGSGKTTLLRIIAGLEFPDQGEVRFAGEDVVRRDARERQVGFVFQHYALFRHMSVFENVAFGLRVRPRRLRPAEAQIRERVMELLRLVQLKRLASRYPHQLSGGQRQRVALARALAIEPRILLLDEPFGALDAKVRKDLRRWLRDLHRRLGLTSVFVTHDQEEALELADQVVLMREGRIEQVGTPRQIYDRPATPFVYEFLGSANRLPCHVQAGRIDAAGGRFEPPYGIAIADGPACLYVRPHDLLVERAGRRQGMAAVLIAVVTTGPTYRLQLKLDHTDAEIEAEMAKTRFDALGLAPGTPVVLRPLEFGLFSTAGSEPAAAHPLSAAA
jgi:sulfate transport system ATP-binding protein